MIKKFFLRNIVKKRLKKRAQNEPRSYIDAKSIGILMNLRNLNKDAFNQFVKDFKNDGKKVSVLYVDPGLRKDPEGRIITKSDISFVGRSRSDKLDQFCKRRFDFLLIIDHELDQTIQYIAANCNAAYTVGFNDFPENRLLDLQVKPAKDNELSDLLKYTKMINHV